MLFRSQPLFTADWYVHLQLPGDAGVNLAILDANHHTIPQAGRGKTAAGLLLNFEVEDVDAVHARLSEAGCTFRSAIVQGNGGRQVLVDDPAGNPIELFEPGQRRG